MFSNELLLVSGVENLGYWRLRMGLLFLRGYLSGAPALTGTFWMVLRDWLVGSNSRCGKQQMGIRSWPGDIIELYGSAHACLL